jgi:hypothetical protein
VSKEAPIEIRGFKGINLREPPGMIQDDELASCINLNIGRAGELVKRTGWAILHDGTTLGVNQVRIVGHLITDTVSQLIIQAGANLYWSPDGSTMNLIGAYTVEFGVQYNNVFYMVRSSGTVVSWNGTVAATIAGSPSGTFCAVYKDRLYVLNTKASGSLTSRLYFSAIADFSATGWPASNFVDVRPGDGDSLTCLAVIHDLLLVFKTRSSWGLYVSGLPANWTLRNTNPEIGCISKYTPREIEGFLHFVGARGVYKTDGNIYEDISPNVQPVFRDRIVNLTSINIDVAAWWDDRYVLLMHPDPSTNRYLVYHLRTGGWTEWVPSGGILPAFFQEVNTGSPSKGLYAGDLNATGRVYRFGGGAYTDAGSNFDASFSTKEFDFGMPSVWKRGKWMQYEFDGTGTPTAVHVREGLASPPVELPDTPRRAAVKSVGPEYFRVWQLQFNMNSNGPFTYYGCTVYLHKKRAVVGAVT